MKTCALLFFLLSLQGCGFYLKGKSDLEHFSTLSVAIVNVDVNAKLKLELEQQWKRQGVVLDSVDRAKIIVKLKSEQVEERILTRNITGRASSYQVQLELSVELSSEHRSASHLLIASDEYEYDNKQMTSALVFKEQLTQSLRKNVIQQLLKLVNEKSMKEA